MDFTRESIFVGAFRSFCTSFSAVVGVLIGAFFIFFLVMMVSGPDYLPPKPNPMVMPDAMGNRFLLPANTPAVLRLDFHGVIGVGDLTADKVQNILLSSREDFLKDRVKAILLHMDTPGGTSSDSDEIYHMILDYKTKYNVPVYAYVEGMCASGGMYIVAAADKIYSSSSGTIGSIGVLLGPTFNFSEAMAKYGISSLTLTEGKDKDMLNPFRPWKPDEAASIRAIMAALYEDFVNVMVKARPRLSKEKLINTYGANVFIAPEAQRLGYIDATGSYSQALSALVQTASMKEDQPYQVVLLSPPHPFLSDLAQNVFKNGKITHTLDLGSYMSGDLAGKFLYLYQPQ